MTEHDLLPNLQEFLDALSDVYQEVQGNDVQTTVIHERIKKNPLVKP